jgi:cytochrome c peroxidase
MAIAAGGITGSAASGQSNDQYVWQLPPGFPQPSVPADNPMSTAKVTLGCRLFFDTRLSVTNQHSCASCHRPELAFTDGRAQALGATGDAVRRNAMTLTNVAYNPSYTWASTTITTLEGQMTTPLFGTHPLELGLKDADAPLAPGIAEDASYLAAFRESFTGDATPVSMRNAIRAIAAFERTLISGRSPFDRYVFNDDRMALSEAAHRGMTLFFSDRLNCTSCHFGLSFAGSLTHDKAHERSEATMFANDGLYNVDGKGGYPTSDTGLYESTRRARDMGRFRIPTLRNVELTAPYMHDGSIATLEEVIEHYAKGGRQMPMGPTSANRLKDADIRPLRLSSEDKQDLAAFLRSLTDKEFADPAKYEPCSSAK